MPRSNDKEFKLGHHPTIRRGEDVEKMRKKMNEAVETVKISKKEFDLVLGKMLKASPQKRGPKAAPRKRSKRAARKA
jgi:hypothetical protein